MIIVAALLLFKQTEAQIFSVYAKLSKINKRRFDETWFNGDIFINLPIFRDEKLNFPDVVPIHKEVSNEICTVSHLKCCSILVSDEGCS